LSQISIQQGLEGFNSRKAAVMVKTFAHDKPDVVMPGDIVLLQAEGLFESTFHIIPFHRGPQFSFYRNAEAMMGQGVGL
jgi:hypothetical protein